jgi:hypothetical protein
MGRFQYDREKLSPDEAKALVGQHIDYLHGKVMKITVPAEGQGDEIETWLFDRDNGEGAVDEVVRVLQNSGTVKAAVATGPAPEETKMARLKNGTIMTQAIAADGIARISSLLHSMDMQDALAFYELVEKSRNPKHKFFGDLGDYLESKGLVQDGDVAPYIRDLVLSGATGKDLDLGFQNPISHAGTASECAASLSHLGNNQSTSN